MDIDQQKMEIMSFAQQFKVRNEPLEVAEIASMFNCGEDQVRYH